MVVLKLIHVSEIGPWCGAVKIVIGSGNGLSLFGGKPLSEQKVTH